MKKLLLAAFVIFINNISKAQDAAISAPSGSFISPVSGCGLSSTENVTVSIFNFGPGTVTNPMTVTYTINGGAPVSEIIAAPNIPLNSSITYTFTTKANLSVGGSYSFDATISVAGDPTPSNNTYTGYSVINTAVSVGGTVSGTANVCKSNNSGVLTLVGHNGTVQNWESSTDAGSTWFAFSNNTINQAYTNLSVNIQYRAIVQNGVCASATSSPAILTMDNPTVAGTISGAATKCTGINSGTLTSAGRTGNILKWQYSKNAGVTWIDTAVTAATLNYTNLTVTTRYRVQVQNGACTSAFSAVAIITISPASVGGTVSGGTTVCSGSNTGALTLGGKTGTVTRWEKSINRGVTYVNVANTTTSLSYTNLTQTTYYRALVTSTPCTAAYSTVDSIVVVNSTTAGTLSASSTVCSGANRDTLKLTGYFGSVSQWEISSDGISFFSLVNTTDTLIFTNLTQITYYRVQVQNGGCASAYSNVVTISVNNPSLAGTISANNTVCSGSNSGTISISGFTGTIQGWQSSNDQISWSAIANTTPNNNFLNILNTTFYRSIIKNGACPAVISGINTVFVDQPSVGGVVNSDTNICSGSNGDTLNLFGNTGNVKRWEFSTDGGNNWQTINNTNTFLIYSNITTTTHYRAVVQNGTCSEANSTAAVLSVDPVSNGGNITGGLTVCGGNNTGSLILSGFAGTIDDWEQSTDLGSSWSSAANFSAILNYSNTNSTIWYRALVTSGVCPQDTSSYGILTIDQPTVGGLLSSDDTVCVVSNSGVLNLTGYTGAIQSWRLSTDAGVTWLSIANTGNSQAYNNLSTSSIYQVLVKSGVCNVDTSNTIQITVGPNVNAGVISGIGATLCSGTNNGTLTLNGFAGIINDWNISNDNGLTWQSLANNSANNVYTNLTDTTWYRVIVGSLACGNDTVSGRMFVDDVSVGGILSASDTICSGANSGVLNLTGFTGVISNWEFTIDGGSTWLPTTNTTTSQAYSNLTLTIQYRVNVKNGVCPSVISNAIELFVEPAITAGTINGSGTHVCFGTNSGTLILTGYIGAITNWNSSSDNGLTYSSLATNSNSITYNNLTDTMFYKVFVSGVACGSDSVIGIVYVDPLTVGGTILSADTVCSGINGDTLQLSGYVGTIKRWEFSPDGGNLWISSTNTSPNQIYHNLSTTTNYAVYVKSGVCAELASNIVSIKVDPTSNAGIITGNLAGCEGIASGNLLLNNHVGIINTWQSSNDNLTWLPIANNTVNQTYTNLNDTTFYRTIVTSGACASDTSVGVSIIVYPKPVSSFIADTVCFGSVTHFTNQSSVASGVNQSMQWSYGDGEFSSLTNSTHEYQQAGTYNVSLFVTSNFGCTGVSNKNILVKHSPTANISASGALEFCKGNTVTLTAADTGAVSIIWNTGATSAAISVVNSGTYKVTVIYTPTGCVNSDSVAVRSLSAPRIELGKDTSISLGNSYQILADADNIVTWSWSPIEGLSSATVKNPIADPAQTTEYIVTAINENGCVDSDTIKITVLNDFNILISNVMTPNADGFNDTWIVQNIETYPNTSVIIVNRNGQQLYQNSSYDNSWDGTYNGKQLPDGTYYYVLRFTGSDKVYKGGLTIVNNK